MENAALEKEKELNQFKVHMYALQILNYNVWYMTQVIIQKMTNSMEILCRFNAAKYGITVQC